MSQFRRPGHEEQAVASQESEKDESSPFAESSAKAAPTRKLDSIYIAAILGIDLGDLSRRSDKEINLISEVAEMLNNEDDSNVPDDVRLKVQMAQAHLEANKKSRCEIGFIKKQLEEMRFANPSEVVAPKTATERIQTIISMESVRIALRSIDRGESAARTKLNNSTSTFVDGRIPMRSTMTADMKSVIEC
eukprot:IDg23217t1